MSSRDRIVDLDRVPRGRKFEFAGVREEDGFLQRSGREGTVVAQNVYGVVVEEALLPGQERSQRDYVVYGTNTPVYPDLRPATLDRTPPARLSRLRCVDLGRSSLPNEGGIILVPGVKT